MSDFIPGQKVRTIVPKTLKDGLGNETPNVLFGEGTYVSDHTDQYGLVNLNGVLDHKKIPLDKIEAIETAEEAQARYQEAINEKLRERYHASRLVKFSIPVIEGAEVRLQTEEEYIEEFKGISVRLEVVDRYVRRLRNPAVYVTTGDFTSTLYYQNVSRVGGAKMLFQVCNRLTDHQTRSYKHIETAAEKLVKLYEAHLRRQARLEKEKQEAESHEAMRKRVLTQIFPNVEKDGREYNIPYPGSIDRYRKLKVDVAQVYNSEKGYHYDGRVMMGALGPLRAEQVNKIMAILEAGE